ncbi:MAG: long-chain fatty acid--CoA ligase [Syntrophales bacterium]|nr:long-chain fatty acid--CoA ligase [Syntrophales bacterium]MCK9528541.1 long-chain fatty acid--CoA ligase [Syntrophales bacterium]MDX9922832.1 long-chain fatty acid--CoA ligase [Syntrophales bacterium]
MVFEKDTLCGLFHRRALRLGDARRFLSSRFNDLGVLTDEYHHMTWKTVRDQVIDFARGLVVLGVAAGDRVALLSESRPRWIIADQAIQGAGAIEVPLHTTLTEDELAWMMADSGARVIVTSTADKASMALRMEEKTAPLPAIIVMEPWNGDRPGNLLTFNEVMELGRQGISIQEMEDRIDSVDPDDITSIIYTSGTTGTPKGVVLKQKHWMANMKQAANSILMRRQRERGITLTHLVHLPLSHAYGRTSDYHVGGLYQGNILVFTERFESLGETIREIRPNVIISVPRLYEKLYDRVHSNVAGRSPRVQSIFKWANTAGMDFTGAMAEGRVPSLALMLRLWIANALVFDSVRKRAGLDRLVLAVSGGGSLSGDVCNFVRSLGVQLNEGYGLTETCAVLNFNEPEFSDRSLKESTAWRGRLIDGLVNLLVRGQSQGRNPFASLSRICTLYFISRSIGSMLCIKPGTVGRPVIGTDERIADDGEILARGPQVFEEYWNLPHETGQAFTEDGWFRTGDIGWFDDDGFLSITDRKKNLFVTSGGQNIAPQPIELALTAQPGIDQAILIGDGRKYCTALIVPDFEKLFQFAESMGLAASTPEGLVNTPEIQALIRSRVDEVNRRVPRHEQVKYCSILTEPFRIETGELTPSMKMKRRVIEEKFSREIEAMYRDRGGEDT